MPRRGRRQRVTTGIYRDQSGLAAIATYGGEKQEKRFPLGTDLETMRRWQATTRGTLAKRAMKGALGSLEGDAKRYLKQVAHLVSHKARRFELQAWIAHIGGTTSRDAITRATVLEARSAWLKDGTAPKTINNRVQTLRHLYRTLDGPEAPTPCDHVQPLSAPKTPAVVVTPELIQRVDARLQVREHAHELLTAKTRARFRVLATTGKRHSEVMRAQPEDVDLERRVWVVPK